MPVKFALPSDLTEAAVLSRLTSKVFGRSHLEVHRKIDSTNLRARELALDGAPEGAVVLAELQTAGRGRLGRAWHSPPGVNVYFSVVLRPVTPLEQSPLITLAAGLGTAEGIGAITGRTPDIKWPNDLLFDEKKTAGILLEMEVEPDRPVCRFAVLGIGVNVNLVERDLSSDPDLSAASVALATGQVWNRSLLLSGILAALEKHYFQLMRGDSEAILARYRQICHTLGRRITARQGRREMEGRAVDIDDSGHLVLERDNGERLALNAGEITLSRPPKK